MIVESTQHSPFLKQRYKRLHSPKSASYKLTDFCTTIRKNPYTYSWQKNSRESHFWVSLAKTRQNHWLPTDRHQIPKKADTFWEGCLVACWTLLFKSGLLTSISIRLCIKEHKRLFSSTAPENKLLDSQSVCYSSASETVASCGSFHLLVTCRDDPFFVSFPFWINMFTKIHRFQNLRNSLIHIVLLHNETKNHLLLSKGVENNQDKFTAKLCPPRMDSPLLLNYTWCYTTQKKKIK